MYISASKALTHMDRLADWQAGRTPPPVTIEADLTNRCYLRCAGCHFAYTHTKGPWTTQPRTFPIHQDHGGDAADLGVTLRWLAEAASCGVQGVIWSGGGEPTLHPHWQTIVAHAERVGLEQGMYTAAGLLTEDQAKQLAAAAAFVVVSLDYADAASYSSAKGVPASSFEAACLGVRWLSAAKGAVIGASFLLHAGNWTQTAAMRDLARDLGVSYTTFRPLIETQPNQPGRVTGDRSWIDRALPALRALATKRDVEIDPARFEAYRDWTDHGYAVCHGIKLTTTITPDGRVWVCPNRREFPRSAIGDLRTESFAQVWAKHPRQWTDFTDCRAMCRLHAVNQALNPVFAPHPHAAFL